MKKTILVVYSNTKINVDACKLKRYAFNTEDNVKVGRMYKTDTYTTNIVVVKILDEAFNYYNSVTGKLSNVFDSTKMGDIKDLKVGKKWFSTNIVRAAKIK